MHDNPTAARADSKRPNVILIGPKDARRRARQKLVAPRLLEATMWRDLPPGPAVCVDARRFEYLSPGAFETLVDELEAGARLVVPASNAGPWPMCGFDAPRGMVGRRELDAHARRLAEELDPELDELRSVDGTYPLPAVFGIADASLLTGCPGVVADLAEFAPEARLEPQVWCHQRERVLLSAAMIVKNEAHNIEAAIGSLSGLVDEVVVYDTGSTDDTVALARAAGAVVREGYWDDDFSRARNEACRMARGEWFLAVDADDRVVGDQALFERVYRLVGQTAVRLPIQLRCYNVTNSVTGQLDSGFWSRRIFPAEMRWRNRVHEVAVLPSGEMPLEVQTLDDLTIRHEGYGGDMSVRRDRNLRLAKKRLEDRGDGPGAAMDWFELGRAACGSGDSDIARPALERAIELAPPNSAENYCSRLFLVGIMKNEGASLEEMDELLAPVIEAGGRPGAAARWVRVGSITSAQEALDGLEGIEQVDYMFANASRDTVDALRTYLMMTLGDGPGALEVMRRMDAPTLQQHSWWTASLAVAAEEDEIVELMVNRLEQGDLPQAVIALMGGPIVGAYDVAMLLLDRFGAAPAVVAYLSSGSWRSGFILALDARVRLEALGLLEQGDPLDALVHHEEAPPADRMLAALVLDEFSPVDPSRACSAAAQVDDEHVPVVLQIVESLMPDLLSEAASALATTPERSAAVLQVLELLDA